MGSMLYAQFLHPSRSGCDFDSLNRVNCQQSNQAILVVQLNHLLETGVRLETVASGLPWGWGFFKEQPIRAQPVVADQTKSIQRQII